MFNLFGYSIGDGFIYCFFLLILIISFISEKIIQSIHYMKDYQSWRKINFIAFIIFIIDIIINLFC